MEGPAMSDYYGGRKQPNTPDQNAKITATAWAILLGLVFLTLVLGLGSCAGVKAFERAQKRADANNNVKVTSINIRKAQQTARIVAAQDATIKARADQRVIEARGIRDAQDIISA